MSFKNFTTLIQQNFQDLAFETKRWSAPLLIGIILCVIFSFGIDLSSLEIVDRSRVGASQLCVILLITAYTLLEQSYDAESRDGVFQAMRLMPIHSLEWFGAKLLTSCFVTFVTMNISLLFWSLFQNISLTFAFDQQTQTALFLCSLGVNAIGIALSSITLSAKSKTLLYPILFFPLICPIILGFSFLMHESLKNYLKPISQNQNISSWYLLILAFSVIFTSLSYAGFNELVSLWHRGETKKEHRDRT